jgi:tRNA dimethylallyltransferase
MLKNGLIDEVSDLIKKYPSTCKPFYSVGYQETVAFLKGQMTASKLEENIIIRTRQLARKQLTWFRGDKEIQWFKNPQRIIEHLSQFC